MRTFAELENLMYNTLNKYSKHLDSDPMKWKLKIDDIKCLGICYEFSKTIVLNKWMVENSPIDQVIDTLMHECAHAFAGEEISERGNRMIHGKKWKQWARRLGATPKATVPISELGKGATEQFSSKTRKMKYHIVYIDNRDNPTKVEIVSSCKRKLSHLENRGMKGKTHTRGNLWHVFVEDYDSYKHDLKKLAKRSFR